MHPSLGSMTLSQLAFPGEGNLNFPWEKSHWDNTAVKMYNLKKKVSRKALLSSCTASATLGNNWKCHVCC